MTFFHTDYWNIAVKLSGCSPQTHYDELNWSVFNPLDDTLNIVDDAVQMYVYTPHLDQDTENSDER